MLQFIPFLRKWHEWLQFPTPVGAGATSRQNDSANPDLARDSLNLKHDLRLKICTANRPLLQNHQLILPGIDFWQELPIDNTILQILIWTAIGPIRNSTAFLRFVPRIGHFCRITS